MGEHTPHTDGVPEKPRQSLTGGYGFGGPEPFMTPQLRKLLVVCAGILAATLVLGGIVSLVYHLQHSASQDAKNTAAAEEKPPQAAKEPQDNAVQLEAEEPTEQEVHQKLPGAKKVESFTVPEADAGWVREIARKAQIPETALKAYAGAALTLKEEMPECRLGWNTLAAIGSVETNHGNLDAAELAADGRALPRIVGPALDGREFKAVRDTDSGGYDGDLRWDHAVGPMQFIPETWSTYHRDADGDGYADIDNIFDQSLSAATLLCKVGGDFTVHENWITAIAAYNPSLAYNNRVAETANHYAELSQ